MNAKTLLIAFWLIVTMLSLSACTPAGIYEPIEGINSAPFEYAHAVCKTESQDKQLSVAQQVGPGLLSAWIVNDALHSAYNNCMARHGYAKVR